MGGTAVSGSQVVEMMGRPKLTAEESEALEVDDTALEGLATSDLAIVGKVLSSSILHIQTIMSALRPAWGNPKGLEAKSVGNNVFIAEFGSKQDLNRVLDGSPWNVGNKAVLVQPFDPNLRPSEVVFDKLAIWIRIYDLPFGLMNKQWGFELGNKVGPVLKVDVDEQGRAWGPFLRVKVQFDISKPLLRCITIFSKKRQVPEVYNVRYEKLPNYCYSCGIIGHSSVECPTPAERDENGILPYGKDLRAQEENKYRKGSEERQPVSAEQSSFSRGQHGSSEDRQRQQDRDYGGFAGRPVTMEDCANSSAREERLAAIKEIGKKDKEKTVYEEKSVGKELCPSSSWSQGTKRKQARTSVSKYANSDHDSDMDPNTNAMALIIANPVSQLTLQRGNLGSEVDLEESGDETSKKMRFSCISYAQSAEAARQPRREP